jgi:hypothetical protein
MFVGSISAADIRMRGTLFSGAHHPAALFYDLEGGRIMLRGAVTELLNDSDRGERHANARGHLHDRRRHGPSVPCGRGRCREFRARNVVATVDERIQALRRPDDGPEEAQRIAKPAKGKSSLLSDNRVALVHAAAGRPSFIG